jgi:hypothetical protein
MWIVPEKNLHVQNWDDFTRKHIQAEGDNNYVDYHIDE